MTTAEIKNTLHKLVVNTEDPKVLQQVIAYFQSLIKENDWWDDLSPKEKEMIEKGLKQVDEGKGVPYEQVREKARKILQKN